ncbi:hypothetical protein [Sphingomonas sanxanigenens]|uniref:Uncharacterized protein n=1 Tax=Sphingomonas sanxanigenens DSM 19645 = NX02 TaxID=1123269 RepID=W0A7Z1_9SPHN|nr:hypothetical protein [Sphingomonas sanxanigenens]AHE54024.1 hypothetical protein NX02_11565 [Sphingomonas sanxanigenens DSM 19645 = NX02]
MQTRSTRLTQTRSTLHQTLAVVGVLAMVLIVLFVLINQAIGDTLIASSVSLTIVAMVAALGASGGTEKRRR